MLRRTTIVLACWMATALQAAPANLGSPALTALLSEMRLESRSSHPKLIGYEGLIDAARNGCPSTEQLERIVRTTEANTKADEPIEIFFLPPLARLIHQFSNCFSDTQLQTIETNLSANRQRLFAHGTVNHAAMRATSWLLLAERFPKATWTDWDGRRWSSAEVRQRIKANLQLRWKGIYQQGHCEWLSPTYSIVNLFPMLNLVDFSADPEVRSGAEAEANLETAVLLANSFHGTILPPLTRKNYDQRNASNPQLKYTPSVAQAALKFYTGEPTNLSNQDWWGRMEPPYVIMLALSNWRPIFPTDLFNKVKRHTSMHIKMQTPAFSEWGKQSPLEISGESYITDNYSLSAGNAKFQPDHYYQHIQVSGVSLKSGGEFNQIECYHPYFSNPEVRAQWGTDRWSPFLQSELTSPTTLEIFGSIPEKDQWPGQSTSQHAKLRAKAENRMTQTVFCRVPKALESIQNNPNQIDISNSTEKVEITSQLAPFVEIDDTLTHRQFKTDGPNIKIKFDVTPQKDKTKNKTNATTYEPASKMSNGYVSFSKLERKLAENKPIVSDNISLADGKLKITPFNQAIYYLCTSKGCESKTKIDHR